MTFPADFFANIIASIGAAGTTNWIALALVIITGFYVILTWRILNSNQRLIHVMTEQFQETVRPYVTATLTVREGVIFVLEVKNRGRSRASNLKLRIDKDFYPFAEKGEERNIRNFDAFNQTISTFSPGEGLSFDLSQSFNMGTKKNGETLTPTQFQVSVNYSFLGIQYSETFDIDTAPYMGVQAPKSSTEHLRLIEEHLKKIANFR